MIGSSTVANNKTDPSGDQQAHRTRVEPVNQFSHVHDTLDQILKSEIIVIQSLELKNIQVNYKHTISHLNKRLVVLAKIYSEVGDQSTKHGIPPPYFCKGTATSIETSHTYMVLSHKDALTSIFPC